ncbi:MAG: hypothetical protein PWQ08_360 [Clostridiales bacterium]|nr:hypothetical protein [Clostridiales bacterium]
MTLAKPNKDENQELEELLSMVAQQLAQEQADAARSAYEDLPEPAYSPRFIEQIKRIARKTKKHGKLIVWSKAAKRTMATAAAVVVVLTATLSVEGVRTQLYNYFISHHQEYTELRVAACDEAAAGKSFSSGDYHYVPSYLPAGYVAEETRDEGSFFYILKYVDQKAYDAYQKQLDTLVEQWGSQENIPEDKQVHYTGPQIMYVEMRSVEGTTQFDTEDAVYKELTINGSPAYMSIKNGQVLLLWDNGDRSFQLFGPISEEDAVNMANSLVVQDAPQ